MPGLSAALEAFAAGTGDIAAAHALTGHAEAELLALVTHLAAAQQRAHLEALGEAGLGKQVKKAARAAAYKLKSAGVSGEAKRGASAIDLSVLVELDRIAIVGPPGLDGQAWIVAAGLPGAAGFEVDLRADDKPARVEAIEDLGRGRLKKFFDQAGAGRSHLAHADLAVRLIDVLEARLEALPGGLPASFAHVARWREVAHELGADGARCDARAALADGGEVAAPEAAAVKRLLEDVRVGYLVPPEAVVQLIDQRFGALMHGDEAVEEATFRAECEVLLDEAADGWLDRSDGATMAGWLDLDADVLLGRGDADGARVLLGMADGIRGYAGAGHEAPLLAQAIRGAIEVESAWQHRVAHVAGHAHHDHDDD